MPFRVSASRLRQSWLPWRSGVITPVEVGGWPSIFIEAAFTTNPGASPAWQDITTYARRFSSARGRQHELDLDVAGLCDVEVDNNDRRFDPTNVAGAYYPNVLPMRRFRIRARWNDTYYGIFDGFVEDWSQVWPTAGGGFALTPIRVVDAFKVYALAEVSATYSAENAGTRIANVLTAVSWPAGLTSIAGGISTVPAATLDKVSALQHMQSITDSEGGRLFIRGDGTFTFQNRHSPSTGTYATSQATFGDGGGSELPYQSLTAAYDDSQIWNSVTATRTGGTDQTASDTTSQASFFKRSLTKTGLLIQTDNEALSKAQYLLTRWKDARLRFTQLQINPRMDPDNLWPHVLGRELGDRITVKRRPPGGGAVMSQVCFIEAIRHEVDRNKTWLTTWQLSTEGINDSPGPFWILDDPTLSALGTSTRLTY